MSQALKNDLTPRQEDAIIALLNEASIPKAAERVKVTPRTIYRWMQEPAFSAAYRKARRDSFSQAVSTCQRYAQVMVNVLGKIATDTTSPAHARVSAAIGVLRFGREGIELDDLAERLKALEDAAKLEKKGEKPWASRAA